MSLAWLRTAGSGVPSDEPAGPLRDRLGGIAQASWQAVRRERWFAVAVAAGVLLRLIAVVGYYPVLWYNDSFEYLGVATRWQAYPIRPDGYSALLYVLRPLHSLALVTILQHAMGIAVAVMFYALMRRLDVRRSIATVASLPQLLDVHQIELEHMLLSDTLFTFLVCVAVTRLAWSGSITPRAALVAGAALGAASLTRTVGLPLLVLALVYLALRRVGWRAVVAFATVSVLTVGGYAVWYHHDHGRFSTTTADGVFLYSRVAGFADCAVIKPPPGLAMLCDPRPSSKRPPGPNYIWHPSPLDNIDGRRPRYALQRFTTQRNDLALRFALHAIAAQPGRYLAASLRDVVRSFGWSRGPYPSSAEVGTYQFSNKPWPVIGLVIVPGATGAQDATAYEQGNPVTRVHRPFSTILERYQVVGWVRGPILLALLLLGIAGLARRDPRRARLAAFVAVTLAVLLIPDFVAQFDYRYVMPVLPLAALAAGVSVEILVASRSRTGAEPDGTVREAG